ncbi:MAG: type II toxin-antitoxin system VapC family toxin [Desulfobacterales bacterium]
MDTHVLVWLDAGSPRLGARTLDQINDAFSLGNLAVSAVSFWEISMLVQKKRLEIRLETDIWRKELLENGLREIQLDGAIAIRAGELRQFHGDPADRMIVATAQQMSWTLATADKRILDWKNLKLKIDARR